MNISGKVKIKDNIATTDIANVVDYIVNAVIYKDGSEIVYQPYFFDEAVRAAILICLVDGVEFDDDDKILELANNERGIKKVLDDFIADSEYVTEIMSYAYDMIDFRKEQYLRQNDELDELLKKAVIKENTLNDILIEVAETQNKVLKQQVEVNTKQEEIFSMMSQDELVSLQRRMANGEFDMNDLATTVVQRYMEADKDRDEKYKEIINEKNKTIVELKDHLKKGGQ